MQLLEIVTVGLPFCVFKIIAGLFFHQYWLTAFGVIDLLFNTANLFGVLVKKRRVVDTCFLAFLVRIFKKPRPERKSLWEDFGNSLDVFLSFVIVALVVGGGFIPAFPALYLNLWNASVILNVIGAGSGRMTSSIRNLKY
jgi:hypothetical protein